MRDAGETSAQLAVGAAELAAAGLPLGPGLRALAAEEPPGRVRRVLTELAARIDAGEPLEKALAGDDAQPGKPALHRGWGALVAAAVAGRQGPQALLRLVATGRFRVDMYRKFWRIVAYPLTVLLIAVGTGVAVDELVRRPLTALVAADMDLVEDPLFSFNQQAPATPTWWEQFTDPEKSLSIFGGAPKTIALSAILCAAALALLAVVGRLVGGRQATALMAYGLPVYGPLRQAVCLTEFFEYLRVMVEGSMPLPQALLRAGEAADDPEVFRIARTMAATAEAGRPLPDAWRRQRLLWPSLTLLLTSESAAPSLSERFAFAAEACRTRAAESLQTAEQVLAPGLVVAAAMLVGLCVSALYEPMILGLKMIASMAGSW